MSSKRGFSDGFAHYLPPIDTQVKDAMVKGMIVLDTNVLLNAYRFAPAARNELLSVLEAVAYRTWIPSRVAEEFHKNRVSVMNDYGEAYSEVIALLKSVQGKLDKDAEPRINQLANRAAIASNDKETLLRLVRNSTGKALSAVEKLREEHGINGIRDADDILDRFEVLYSGKVGEPFDDEDHAAALKEANHRIEKRIPPGYCDSDKDEPFGDYFVWKQVMNEAAQQKPAFVVFVTSDSKDDWNLIIKNQVLCARPELAKELRDGSGAGLIILSLSSFLHHSREYLNAEVSGETIRQSASIDAHQEHRRLNLELRREAAREIRREEAQLRSDLQRRNGRLMNMEDELASIMHSLRTYPKDELISNELRSYSDQLRHEALAARQECDLMERRLIELADSRRALAADADEIHRDRPSRIKPLYDRRPPGYVLGNPD